MTQLMFSIIPQIKHNARLVLHSINPLEQPTERNASLHNWFLIILKSIIIARCSPNSWGISHVNPHVWGGLF